MTPSEAIAIYLDDGRTRHLADATVRGRDIHLKRFTFWCGCVHMKDLRDAVAETLTDYRRWLGTRKRYGTSRRSSAEAEQPISIQYANSQARTVRLLFKLLYKRGLIMSDITAILEPLRDPLRLPRGIMNKDQVMQMLQQPYMTTPLGFRDRTILEVLYSTALRGGELCRITLYDLDLPGRTLRVLGKGSKERVVPIGKVAVGYLGEYIKSVRGILQGKRNSSIIFLSATGLPLRTADLGRIVRTHRDKARLPDNITVHSLRHTCATEMLKGGASIRHVQELLGHASIQTTQIYTHVVQTDLQKAHARTAPSERRKSVDVPEFNTDHPGWNDRRNIPYWPGVRGNAARQSQIRRGGKAEQDKSRKKQSKARKKHRKA